MSTGGPPPPRITPGDRTAIGPVNALITRVIGLGAGTGRAPNVFTTVARHRRLFRAWLRFASRLMPGGTLRRADSELVILRVAHRCGSEYEWRHHERIGRLPASRRSRSRPSAPSRWRALSTPGRSLLVRAVDELHDDRTLSDPTWAALAERLSDTELIELCLLAGHYEMLAMTLNSLRVQPDPAPIGRGGVLAVLRRGR